MSALGMYEECQSCICYRCKLRNSHPIKQVPSFGCANPCIDCNGKAKESDDIENNFNFLESEDEYCKSIQSRFIELVNNHIAIKDRENYLKLLPNKCKGDQ